MLKIISLGWLEVFNSDNFSIVSEERSHFCRVTTQKNVFTNKNIDMQNILDQKNIRLPFWIGLYHFTVSSWLEIMFTEAEFKEFEPRLKFETGIKYGWFHFKLYSMFQDLSRRSIETGFGGFETRLKFIKFGHNSLYILFICFNFPVFPVVSM